MSGRAQNAAEAVNKMFIISVFQYAFMKNRMISDCYTLLNCSCLHVVKCWKEKRAGFIQKW